MSHAYADRAAVSEANGAAPGRQPVRVGSAHDPLEHEAERVAARILSTTAGAAAPPVTPDGDGGPLRRSCECGGTCGGCDDERTVRRLATGTATADAGSAVDAALRQPGRPLPSGDRSFFETRLGTSLGDVRLRAGPAADAAARDVGAKAFTLGDDVVVASPYVGDRSVLAHELVHVLQARAGRTSGTVRRQAAAPPVAVDPASFVRTAADHIETLRDVVAQDIALAERDLAAAPAPDRQAVVERHLPIVGQAALGRRLAGAQRIYDAQRALVGPDDPAQGRLREAYSSFLHTMRSALDRSRALAGALPQAARDAEEARYTDNLVAWLAANPFLDSRIAGRTTFTAGEATASATMETDVASAQAAVVASAYSVNLADAARAQAVQDALGAARTVVTAGTPPTTAPAAAPTGAVGTALTELRRWVPAVANSIAVLDRATTAIEAWLAAPATAPGTQATVQRFFNTTDAGYGRLLADRIALLRRQVAGQGELVMTLARPGDAQCGPQTGGHAATYRVWLCPNAGGMDPTMVVLHEAAHAVMPGRGSRPRAVGVTTVDRAYAGERLMGRLPTEEALSNAQSYAEVVLALGDPTFPLRTITTDTVTRACATQSDTDKILDAMARAQSLARRASTWIDGWRRDYATSGAYPQWVRDLLSGPLGAARAAPTAAATGAAIGGAVGGTTGAGVGRAIGGVIDAAVTAANNSATDADMDTAFADMSSIAAQASIWHIGHDVACAANARGRCSGGVLAWTTKYAVTASAVTARQTTAYPSVVTFCPDFLSSAEDLRNRVAYAIVAASYGWGLARPGDLLKYAAAAQAIWGIDLPAPPAANLAEHQAADAAVP